MGHAMKLLVVEDENKTADYVRQGLMEAGFVVDLARNGLDGHHLAMSETYDLVVLDVMLPDVDGWRIVRSLRDAGKQVPVLFLTARGSVDDRVKGLELGADDYLVKPFAFSELLARVRTLLRRGSAPSQPIASKLPIWCWTCRADVQRALVSASISPARSSRCSNCWHADRVKFCRVR